MLNVKKCMCWCLSVIELKNVRWEIEIQSCVNYLWLFVLFISGLAEEICRFMQFNQSLIFDYRPRQANTDNTEGGDRILRVRRHKRVVPKVILQCTYFEFLTFNSNKRNSNSKYIANLLILHLFHIRCISLNVERDVLFPFHVCLCHVLSCTRLFPPSH